MEIAKNENQEKCKLGKKGNWKFGYYEKLYLQKMEIGENLRWKIKKKMRMGYQGKEKSDKWEITKKNIQGKYILGKREIGKKSNL